MFASLLRTTASSTSNMIHDKCTCLIILLLFCFCPTPPGVDCLSTRSNLAVMIYPDQVISERDLHICEDKAVCSVLYKRFWLPPIVERMCRCPDRHECPWTWKSEPDDYTMELDNRSQLKFCQQVRLLPKCSAKRPAVMTQIHQFTENDIRHRVGRHSNKHTRHTQVYKRTAVTAHCYCPRPHYWKLKVTSNVTDDDGDDVIRQTYYCTKLKKCNQWDMCGHIRTDYLSTSYRCSCPQQHLCINKDKTIHHVSELLYNSTAYKGYCVPKQLKRKRRY